MDKTIKVRNSKMKYINVVLRKEDKKNRKLLLKSINRRKKRGTSAMYIVGLVFVFFIFH